MLQQRAKHTNAKFACLGNPLMSKLRISHKDSKSCFFDDNLQALTGTDRRQCNVDNSFVDATLYCIFPCKFLKISLLSLYQFNCSCFKTHTSINAVSPSIEFIIITTVLMLLNEFFHPSHNISESDLTFLWALSTDSS